MAKNKIKKSEFLKPTKQKVIGSFLVYAALLVSSIFKVFLVSTFYLLKEGTEETLQSVQQLNGGFEYSPAVSLVILVLSSALEFFLIYAAVSYSIYISKVKK